MAKRKRKRPRRLSSFSRISITRGNWIASHWWEGKSIPCPDRSASWNIIQAPKVYNRVMIRERMIHCTLACKSRKLTFSARRKTWWNIQTTWWGFLKSRSSQLTPKRETLSARSSFLRAQRPTSWSCSLTTLIRGKSSRTRLIYTLPKTWYWSRRP